jgi:hypothetical protein
MIGGYSKGVTIHTYGVKPNRFMICDFRLPIFRSKFVNLRKASILYKASLIIYRHFYSNKGGRSVVLKIKDFC